MNSHGGQKHYLESERPLNPSTWTLPEVVATILVLAVASQYIFKLLDVPLQRFLDRSWHAFVFMMPSSLVYGFRFGPMKQTSQSHHAPNRSVEHAEKNEILQNAFGIRTGQDAPGRGWSQHSKAPKGLGNFDNSCYQNSVLQALAAVPSVQEYFNSIVRDSRADDGSSTVEALQDLALKLNDPEGDCTYFWTPARLKSMSSWQQQDAQEYFSKVVDAVEKEAHSKAKKMISRQLPDLTLLRVSAPRASQLARDGVRESEDSAHVVVQTVQTEGRETLPSPLEGLMAQRVGCTECGYCEGLSLVPFNCLTLPLGRAPAYTLGDCLHASTELEYIEGVECPSCSLLALQRQLHTLLEHMLTDNNFRPGKLLPELQTRTAKIQQRLERVEQALKDEDFSDETLRKACSMPDKLRKTSIKSKQVALIRAPQCLTMHVNRSMFDEYTGAQLKNFASIDFPETLDVTPWIVGGSSQDRAGEDHSAAQDWPTDPQISMLTADTFSKKSSVLYSLKAAITHHGRHENGHYICYRQSLADYKDMKGQDDTRDCSVETDGSAPEDLWWRISDEYVSPVSLERVLDQPETFMLFYERTQADLSIRTDQQNLVESGASIENNDSISMERSANDDGFEAVNSAPKQNASAAEDPVELQDIPSAPKTPAKASDQQSHPSSSYQHQWGPAQMRTATPSQFEPHHYSHPSPVVAPI